MLPPEARPGFALALGCFVSIVGVSLGAYFAAASSKCDPVPDWVLALDKTDRRAAMDWWVKNVRCTGSNFLHPGALVSFSVGLVGFGSWSYGLVKIQPD